MSFRDQITRALDSLPNLREYDRFQEMAFLLARPKWSGLRLTRKTSDRGADAIDEGTGLALACGWNGDLQKLRGDCRRLSDERPAIKDVVFATSLAIDEIQIKAWGDAIKKEFGMNVVAVMHRDWIIGELSGPQQRWIAHEFLDLPIDDFADLATHLPLIAEAASRITDAWKVEHDYLATTLVDLRMKETGPGGNGEFRRSDLAAAIYCGGLIWLLGQPGSGKTHSLISLADDILAAERFQPVLVSLRRWGHQGGRLLDFIVSEPAFRQQGVSSKTFATAVEAGKIVLLLNGWNEVSDAQRRLMEDELRTIRSQLAATSYVITARNDPSLSLIVPPRILTLTDLNDDEVEQIICRAGISDAGALSKKILADSRVASLARVPLFLRELIAEAKCGRDLPATRYGVLAALVARATEEHRHLLDEAGLWGCENRYLGSLAWRMTEQSLTSLDASLARECVSMVSVELLAEGLIGSGPAPTGVLEKLAASHLLVRESGDTEVTFAHQLVQEYFTATELARRLQGAAAENAIQTALSQWQWALPVLMCIEKLSEAKSPAMSARLLCAFAAVDFEAACRAAAIAAPVWPLVQGEIDAGIKALVESGDINARWLAARCAAATGQSEFDQLVFDGLAGYPANSENCFAGLPLESVFGALGPSVAERVLAVPDPALRFRILHHLSVESTKEALDIAATLAIRDDDTLNRQRSFEVLFQAKERCWLRSFVQEVRREAGWSLALLIVVRSSSQCSLNGWRRRMRRLRTGMTRVQDRVTIQNTWATHDLPGAREDAQAEYEWCRSQSSIRLDEMPALAGYRRLCLRRGAKADPEWARGKILQDLKISDLEKLGALPLHVLTQSERSTFVQRWMLEAIRSDRSSGGRTETLAGLAPTAAAAVIFQTICSPGFLRQKNDERRFLSDAAGRVSRAAIIEEICRREYHQPTPEILPVFLNAIARGRDPIALRVLSAETRTRYQKRLHIWREQMPSMGQETAPIWADLAALFGELGHEDDASFVIAWLKEDVERVLQRQRDRQAQVDAYIASNRTTTAPGPHDACSYSPSYYQALSGFAGPRVVAQITELLDFPEHLGFASHWLANAFDAPHAESFEQGWGNKRFDLITERRLRSEGFLKRTASVAVQIKAAVDRELLVQSNRNSSNVISAFLAVARLEGAAASDWVMDRMEGYFSDGSWSDYFEQMMLLGCTLDGNRLMPFMRRTIEMVRSVPIGVADHGYQVIQTLTTLFYGNAPELALQIFSEAKDLIQDHSIRNLLVQIRWVSSPVIGAWLGELVATMSLSADIRVTAANVMLRRAKDRGDTSTVLSSVLTFVSDPAMEHSDHSYALERLIGEIAADDEAMRAALLHEAERTATVPAAVRWLKIIPQIGGVVGVLTAFRLVERFGEEALPVVSALAPYEQTGTQLSFGGWAFLMRRVFYFHPKIMSELYQMVLSRDKALGTAARRALIWIERERIEGYSPSVGDRGIPWDPSLKSWPVFIYGGMSELQSS